MEEKHAQPGNYSRFSDRVRYFIVIPAIIILMFPMHDDALAQTENPYHLPIISDTAFYNAQCRADSNNILVNLGAYMAGIMLDIRYATDENFTGEVIYPSAMAFARLPVAKALKRVQADLAAKGLGLKIYDAYRPYSATLVFWDIVADTLYVAAPWKGSRHNRGCAVDVSVFDTVSGNELEMPTPYDDFTEAASPSYSSLPEDIMENRNSLIEIMSRYGFTVFESEWWHFDFNGWEAFSLLDIPFSELPD